VTTPQALAQAVLRVWRRHPHGFGFLAARRGELWIERGFRINDGDGVEEFFERYSFRRYDLYFCLNAFSRKRRLGMYAHETPFAHVDIDGGDPASFVPSPSILTETSPGRYQGIWEFATMVEPKVAESLSRALGANGDRGGWSITKMLRVPGSLNHKDAYDLPVVTVVRDEETPIAAWPVVQPEITKEPRGPRARAQAHEPIEVTPAEYDAALARFNACLRAHEPSPSRKMWLIKRVLKTKDQPDAEDGPDRSHILRQILLRLRDLELTPEETFALAWRSGWNKFRIDDRRDGEGDLWHEVKKAMGRYEY
jgi:RepB DNA-primase from phage plasmid